MDEHGCGFLVLIFCVFASFSVCQTATDFCNQPLGMERWIIADDQITASTTYNSNTHMGKEARLNNARSWCSRTGTTITDQWVKVDLKKPMSITGIKIQGDPQHSPNYITKFKLDYNYDGGTTFYGKIDTLNIAKVFVGASSQSQLEEILFLSKPFTARYVRFRPVEKSSGGNDVCVRFELNGCAYVCSGGLGIEHGAALPFGFSLTASSAESGKEAVKARLSDSSSWCANTNNAYEYLQIDFGRVVTMSGLAIQGDHLQNNWVKDFYIDYGTTVTSLTAYQEDGSTKLFIGNKDQSTIVVHWFQVRLTARYLRIKPNQFNRKKCLRIEVIGCDSEFVGEVGAENRVLEDSSFFAYGWNEWTIGRYLPKDGRLNNDKPWGNKGDRPNPWFKVDLGRIMVVNGISTQGDATYGSNYFPDYKLQFSLQETGVIVVNVKEEGSSTNKVFDGNTNNMGVKFNFLKDNPISARHLQFLENRKPSNDYTLRIEVYARPQICAESFGLVDGEPTTYMPTITGAGGAIPSSDAKINSKLAWCGTGNAASLLYDLGSEKQVSGIAIQGNPTEDEWVKTFKVQLGSLSSSLTTYQVSGSDKVFVGCKSRNLIVYNWFSTVITTRYLKIIPATFKTEACLRLNIYGCPSSGCFKPVGIASSVTIANSLITSSTSTIGNEAYKGRLNAATSWSACQIGSCSPQENSGAKPWIQLCLAASQMISGVIIQGFGEIKDLAHVSSFGIKYEYPATKFYDYKIRGSVKVFQVSTGRYGSKQINFPTPVAAKCIKLQVETQSSTSKNVGMRWELLGCTPVSLKAVVTIPKILTVNRGSTGTVTCTGTGQPGLTTSFKSSGAELNDSDIYKVEGDNLKDTSVDGKTTRELKVTAKASSIVSAYTTCKVTDQTNGLVQCEKVLECSASYPGIASSEDTKSFTVNVTDLKAKPEAPTGLSPSIITKESVKVTWVKSDPADFPVENYKVSIKRKTDATPTILDQIVSVTEASFTGLTVYTEYTVEVSAKSTKFNVYSVPGSHTFRTDEGAALAPSDITATPVSDTEVQLTWKEPSLMNGVLHEYKVRYKKTSESKYSSAISSGKELLGNVKKLEAFTEYHFQVSASTKGGSIEGAWSTDVKEKTQEGLPLVPRALQSVSVLQSSVLLKWEKPIKENGIIRNYTLQLSGTKSYNATFSQQISFNKSIDKDAKYPLQFNATSLIPGSTYNVKVAASTGRGMGEFTSFLSVKTLYTAPPRANLLKETKSSGNTEVTLRPVWDINGPIARYDVTVVNGRNANCAVQAYKMSVQPSSIPFILSFQPGVEEVTGWNSKVETVGNFTVCYRGVIVNESDVFNGPPGRISIERKTLKKVETSAVPTDKITSSQVVVPLVEGPTGSKYYQVIVIENVSGSSLAKPDTYKTGSISAYVASTYKPGTPYITAEFSSSSFSTSFTIGDGKQYSKSKRKRRNTAGQYTNVGLKADTAYLVFQRAFLTDDKYYSSQWIGPVTTKKSAGGKTDKTSGGGNVGMIVGVVIAVIVILALVVVAAYFVKRSRRGKQSKEPDLDLSKVNLGQNVRTESHPVGEENNVYVNDEEDGLTNKEVAPRKPSIIRRRSSAASLHRKKPPTEVKNDRHHPPVSVSDFAKHSRQLQKDSHHALTTEYNSLKKGQLYPWDIAMSAVNKTKNRYANIAAYDHSRVRLQLIPGEPHSDYYNANYISSYRRPSVYIAAQGPVDNNEAAFWRTIWDNEIYAVVMLTNVVERGKKKCAQYFPDGGELYFGDFTIQLSSLDNYVDYVIRKLTLKKHGHSSPRTIYHFHFMSWPDHGVPDFPTDLLNFRKKVRKYFPFDVENQILVHCSAGVGRTGTFIVIDAMLDLALHEQKVDVFNYVNFIRSQRIQLVQVEEQYIFIYHALLEWITCGITEIETQDFRIKTGQLQREESNGKTGFQNQFERLDAITHQLLPAETTAALKPTNERRNRREDVLPRDLYRVVLQQSIYENDCSDYINATYVDGYKMKDAYIATEHPIPETISDFWTMIHQQEVSTIVILNQTKNGPHDFPVYWPSVNNETRYGNIFVSNQFEGEETNSIRRTMHVRHRDLPDKIEEVEIFQCPYWPEHNVPKDTTRLLSFIAQVDRSRQMHGDQPIVVICSDGASRTGTFIAISLILERFKTEQLIDVFQTIKKLRFFRPRFVENAVQYQFCFNMAQAYMDSFDTYSNFTGY